MLKDPLSVCVHVSIAKTATMETLRDQNLSGVEEDALALATTNSTRFTARRKAFLGVLALVATCSLLVCVCVFFFVQLDGLQEPPLGSVSLRYSEEYQVSLYPEDWGSAKLRVNMASEFLDLINFYMSTQPPALFSLTSPLPTSLGLNYMSLSSQALIPSLFLLSLNHITGANNTGAHVAGGGLTNVTQKPTSHWKVATEEQENSSTTISREMNIAIVS